MSERERVTSTGRASASSPNGEGDWDNSAQADAAPEASPAGDMAGPAAPGRLLAKRYRLELQLASGGMAQVWQATDEVLRRKVAVKLLHPHLLADDTFVARFQQEAVAAARLAHPGIVVDLRHMHRWRHRGHRDGAAAGPHAARAPRRGHTHRPLAGSRVGRPGSRRSRSRPSCRARAPRHQASQHPAGRRRQGEGRRLRHRKGGRRR